MRTVLAVTLALALGGPMAASAATNASAGVSQMVASYSGIHTVRVVERFENGAAATVDVMPAGQYRIASTGGQDPALIIKIATQPGAGADGAGKYTVNSVGHKTIEGIAVSGYHIVAPDGSYDETVWVSDKQHLPVSAHVETAGHKIDATFGDYNDSALIARP